VPVEVDFWKIHVYSVDWNQLPKGAMGTSHSKTHIFKTRARKV